MTTPGPNAKHTTGTRDQWLAARLELLKAEKELTQRSDELARRRQALPWVRVDKNYRFETDEGSASLADLFKGRSQLLVYHFMFGPEYTAGCPSCSSIADGFSGIVVHLANHDVTLSAALCARLAETVLTPEITVEGETGMIHGIRSQQEFCLAGCAGVSESASPPVHGGVQIENRPRGRCLQQAG